MKVIWVVFEGREINPLGGKVISIDEEQFNQLNHQGSRNFRR